MEILNFQGKYFLFYYFENPLLELHEIYMQEINPHSGVFIGESLKLYSLKHAKSFDKIDIAVDREQSHFLMHYKRMIKYENDPTFYDEYNLLLLDAHGKLLHIYNYVPPYSRNKIASMLANIDSDPNIYLIINLKNKNKNDKASVQRIKIPYQSSAMQVHNNTCDPAFVDIDLLYSINDKKLLAAGLYGLSDKKARSGFFLLDWNLKTAESTSHEIEFPIETISSYTSKKEEQKMIKKIKQVMKQQFKTCDLEN